MLPETGADLARENGGWTVRTITVYRTRRRPVDGVVLVPEGGVPA